MLISKTNYDITIIKSVRRKRAISFAHYSCFSKASQMIVSGFLKTKLPIQRVIGLTYSARNRPNKQES